MVKTFSRGMQKAGLFAFTASALDGCVKGLWREAPIPALSPQVGAPVALGAVFLVGARLLARRWETVQHGGRMREGRMRD